MITKATKWAIGVENHPPFQLSIKRMHQVEEDRKPSAPEPFYSAFNFLALRLAMAALT